MTEPKIDGSAVSLVYENGRLHARCHAWRRRAGRGRDAEPSHDQGDPARHAHGRRGAAARGARGARRGLFPASAFNRLNERLVAEGKKTAPNPRNAAAGSLRQLNSADHCRAGPLHLGLRHRPRGRARARRRTGRPLEWLRERGFRTNPHAKRHDSLESVARECVEWEKKRIELDYEIDGIVIKVDSLDQQQRPRRAPRTPALGARLQVGADDGADEALEDPRARRAAPGRSTRGPSSSRSRSAASPSRRRRSTTRRTSTARTSAQGDTVIVQRAGDVIPQVVGPVLPHAKGTKRFRMPKKCPLCGTEIVKPEGEVMHRCPNNACPSRGLESLINWVMAAADIEGVGEQFVRRLWDLGLLRSIPDLYRLTKEQLAELDGYARDLGRKRRRRDRRVQADSVLARPLRPQHPRRRLGDRAEPRPPLRLGGRPARRAPGGHRGSRGHRPRPSRVDRDVVRRREEPDARRGAAEPGDPARARARPSAPSRAAHRPVPT